MSWNCIIYKNVIKEEPRGGGIILNLTIFKSEKSLIGNWKRVFVFVVYFFFVMEIVKGRGVFLFLFL